MNLADPELELIDPTPNVHNLFIHFDKEFFWAKLASRAVVRWSKRMYSCAGVCSYEGRGGLCDIALSEPLLKLRPRKDLVETLLHEMIHAFLFVTSRDQDRDGHGPNFKAHMFRINNAAGLNISIYHDFHDEVKLYQTHWWRCNGSCQTRRPFFGIVRRPSNRAPGPSDYWWQSHMRNCGGTFIKIKEPEKKPAKPAKGKAKPKGDITKYVTNKKTENVPTKPVLKDSNSIPVNTKKNGNNTVVLTKKEPVFNPQPIKSPVLNTQTKTSPVVFSGKGQTLGTNRPRSNSLGVNEMVRNIWANKQIPVKKVLNVSNVANKSRLLNNTTNFNSTPKTNKHKSDTFITSPPTKITKIDDYFKKTASTTLRDLYGQDFKITQSNKDQKFLAVPIKSENTISKHQIKKEDESNVVPCPICNAKINNEDINRHLDECLNKEVIENLCKDNKTQIPQVSTEDDKKNLREMVGILPSIPEFRGNENMPRPINALNNPTQANLQKLNNNDYNAIIKMETEDEKFHTFDSNDVNKVKEIVIKINHDKELHKSDNIILKEVRPYEVNTGTLPSYLDDMAVRIPKIKTEPGTSKGSEFSDQKCACCGRIVDKPLEEHLDECLAFFSNNTTVPEEGASTSFINDVIVIDVEDDIFDESQTMNATGTKWPCPCCLQMIEEADMNAHLDLCLG